MKEKYKQSIHSVYEGKHGPAEKTAQCVHEVMNFDICCVFWFKLVFVFLYNNRNAVHEFPENRLPKPVAEVFSFFFTFKTSF